MTRQSDKRAEVSGKLRTMLGTHVDVLCITSKGELSDNPAIEGHLKFSKLEGRNNGFYIGETQIPTRAVSGFSEFPSYAFSLMVDYLKSYKEARK